MIISVSRRCDIPRFQFDWFMQRLNEGFVDVSNPFNAAQVRRISLLPKDAEAFVFWTRDPHVILAHAEYFENRNIPFYVMVTVTGYPPILEPNIPPPEIVCDVMGNLSQRIGANRVIWRYDPVFFSSVTNSDFHQENFSVLARRLAGPVRRVIISLYDEYGGAKRRIKALESTGLLKTPPQSSVGPLFASLAQTARAAGMEIQSCAEAEPLAPGIKPGACIDAELLRNQLGVEAGGKDKNQRPYCLCAHSVDIGRYGDCPAGCVYCYASR